MSVELSESISFLYLGYLQGGGALGTFSTGRIFDEDKLLIDSYTGIPTKL